MRVCTETGKRPSKTWSAAADLLHCFSVNSDGSAYFGGGDNGRVYVWDKKGAITLTLDGHK